MDDTMAPPSKRRKLLEPAQDVVQQFETATKPSIPPFSHGVEHIPATKPAQALYARPSPHHIEELHLEIQTRSVPGAADQIRLLRRQGTAALTDIITTNSEAEVVVAVTAMVDAMGSTTALTTAAVTVDVPDLSSLLGTLTTTAVVSTDSAEPTASSFQETSAEPSSSSAQETSVEPSLSTAQESSPEPTSSSGSSQSETASTSNDSRSSDTPSPTNASTSSSSTSDTSLPIYAVSPASENGTDNDPQSDPSSSSLRESEAGSSVVPSSTTDSAPASYGPASYGPASYGSSSSQDTATLESSTSSNSTVPVSTSASSQSQTSQTVFTPTGSEFSGQTGSASSRNSLNMTTSASTSTSGSVILVSDFTANYASSTSSIGSQATDSSSSIDLNSLYLLTQSNGEVSTLTRSDEPFTTSLSGGSEIVVPASSSAASDSRISASSVSAYVTTISNDQTTVRSTAFSTASASSAHSSSDDTDGVGLAGVAGDGATATSNGVSTTSAPVDTNDTNDGDDDPAPAGTIAGGVVGGAAGLALVALIILLFLRRYKKRAQLGHLALPANASGPADGASAGSSSGGRGMAERAGLMPLVGAVPALFRHQNRSQNSESEAGERGFQRVAGRKLPSAFSEGMTGPPQPTMSPLPSMPLVGDDGHERNLSSHSFYRDSAGFYGGDGSTAASPNPFSDSNLPATVAGSTAAHQMVMSPGPQRRPTIHAAKSNVQEPSVATSGTPSWTPSYTATFARSETPASLDSGRNSRFTEEV